jgi:hypothetical protein
VKKPTGTTPQKRNAAPATQRWPLQRLSAWRDPNEHNERSPAAPAPPHVARSPGPTNTPAHSGHSVCEIPSVRRPPPREFMRIVRFPLSAFLSMQNSVPVAQPPPTPWIRSACPSGQVSRRCNLGMTFLHDLLHMGPSHQAVQVGAPPWTILGHKSRALTNPKGRGRRWWRAEVEGEGVDARTMAKQR